MTVILRKTPSQFLRTLREISPDALPALPQKRLSRGQQKRLEDAVFTRIGTDRAATGNPADNRTVNPSDSRGINAADSQTVFERYADNASVTAAPAPTEEYEMRYEITPIGGAWKRNLAMALAACLCFAIIGTAFLFRGSVAQYLTGGLPTDAADTQAVHDTTNALYWESDLPETGVEPPYESAKGFALEVAEAKTGIGQLSLSLKLHAAQPMEGITVQYRRVILSRWDSDRAQFETLYDIYTTDRPKLEVVAGDVHFPIIGMGQTKTAEGLLTVSRDLRGQAGLYFITLEGLTLVRDAEVESTESYEDALTTEVLTDGTVCGSFVIFPESTLENTSGETLPPRNTVTPPPDAACPPALPAENYTLSVKNESITDNAVTLGLRLETTEPLPDDGYAVFYKSCDIDLWNHEKQVWENKYGTNDADAPFVNMVLAGDIHFLIEGEDHTADASLPFTLPDDGWYRITLRGLVLVREAREGENAEWNLVVEPLDDGAVYAVFHKES